MRVCTTARTVFEGLRLCISISTPVSSVDDAKIAVAQMTVADGVGETRGVGMPYIVLCSGVAVVGSRFVRSDVRYQQVAMNTGRELRMARAGFMRLLRQCTLRDKGFWLAAVRRDHRILQSNFPSQIATVEIS